MRFSLKLQDHSGLFIWLHRLYEFQPIGGLRPGKRLTLKVTASVLMVRARNPGNLYGQARSHIWHFSVCSSSCLREMSRHKHASHECWKALHSVHTMKKQRSSPTKWSFHITPAHSALHPALQTCRSVHLQARTSLPTFPVLPILDLPDYSSFFRAQLTPHPPGRSWPHGNTCLCLGLPGTCEFMLFPHFSL